MTSIEEEIKLGDYTVGLNGVAVIKNTFWQDFTIAEIDGASGVQDTYERAFDSWKNDIKYMTALTIVLNHKIFQHYRHDDTLARLYDKLWREIDMYILDGKQAGKNFKYKNFTTEEVHYFLRATD